MSNVCYRCGSRVIKNGIRAGSQRYKCTACNHEFTDRGTQSNNTLAFSCVHIPYEHVDYLDFILHVRDKYSCDNVICLGDMFDNHSISFHDHDPDGMSSGQELDLARKRIVPWTKAIPELTITYGNHDRLIYRKLFTHGLSKKIVPTLNAVYELPDTWEWVESTELFGIKYCHGDGIEGKFSYANRASTSMQCSVTGHTHSVAGVHYSKTSLGNIWGMGVGCGIDDSSYAFAYNKGDLRRPVLGCGVVLDGGTQPIFIPME